MTRIHIIDRAIEVGLVALVVLAAILAVQMNVVYGVTSAFSEWYAGMVDSFLVVEDLVVDAPRPDGYQRLTAADVHSPADLG